MEHDGNLIVTSVLLLIGIYLQSLCLIYNEIREYFLSDLLFVVLLRLRIKL